MTVKQVRDFLIKGEKEKDLEWLRGMGGRPHVLDGKTETVFDTVKGTVSGTVLSVITLLNYDKYAQLFTKNGTVFETAKGTVKGTGSGNSSYIKKRKEIKKEYIHENPSGLVIEPKQKGSETEEENHKLQKNKKTDPRIKRLIDFFYEQHTKIIGEKPHIIGGRDASVFKRLLATFPEEEIQERLIAFLNDPLHWADTPVYSTTLFEKLINKYSKNFQQPINPAKIGRFGY
jgi:hypothetical protein